MLGFLKVFWGGYCTMRRFCEVEWSQWSQTKNEAVKQKMKQSSVEHAVFYQRKIDLFSWRSAVF